MDQKSSASAHRAGAQATARIYTKPELRERLKDELLAGNRGGAPGEWSAHKAELLAHEYRQAGGGYTFAKRSPTHPQDWSGTDQQPEQRGNQGRPQQAWTNYASTTRPATNDQQRDSTRPTQQSAAELNQQPEADE